MTNYKTVITIIVAVFVTVPVSAASYAARGSKHKSHHTIRAKKLNINVAKKEDLMKLRGMSSYKAHAIVAFRKKHGKFKSLDDLVKVKGFKHMKAEKMTALTKHLALV